MIGPTRRHREGQAAPEVGVGKHVQALEHRGLHGKRQRGHARRVGERLGPAPQGEVGEAHDLHAAPQCPAVGRPHGHLDARSGACRLEIRFERQAQAHGFVEHLGHEAQARHGGPQRPFLLRTHFNELGAVLGNRVHDAHGGAGDGRRHVGRRQADVAQPDVASLELLIKRKQRGRRFVVDARARPQPARGQRDQAARSHGGDTHRTGGNRPRCGRGHRASTAHPRHFDLKAARHRLLHSWSGCSGAPLRRRSTTSCRGLQFLLQQGASRGPRTRLGRSLRELSPNRCLRSRFRHAVPPAFPHAAFPRRRQNAHGQELTQG